MTSEVLYSVVDRVATITLNRPEKLNAWTPRMQVQLKEAILRAADESEVRVIVVTGAGRGFCAGADIGDLGQPALHGLHRWYLKPVRLPIPPPGHGPLLKRAGGRLSIAQGALGRRMTIVPPALNSSQISARRAPSQRRRRNS